nr:myosin heavy chain, fast skeletal muscle [Tanacetum cinerariifolium]
IATYKWSNLTLQMFAMTVSAGELKKEETAAKLKEQRWLEEKAKATEAFERKKQNAEKAQIRALRSWKETGK